MIIRFSVILRGGHTIFSYDSGLLVCVFRIQMHIINTNSIIILISNYVGG